LKKTKAKHKVYHFTTTGSLPWIIKSGKLVPTRDHMEGLPPSDFLWASTVARGEPNAPAVISRKLEWDHTWECDFVRLVRFTLAAEDFEPWSKLIKRCPQWLPEHVKLMKDHARSWGGSASSWRCRTEPVGLEKWIAVETRPYSGPWQPFDYRDPDFVAACQQLPALSISSTCTRVRRLKITTARAK
jgi:hypothetical protein